MDGIVMRGGNWPIDRSMVAATRSRESMSTRLREVVRAAGVEHLLDILEHDVEHDDVLEHLLDTLIAKYEAHGRTVLLTHLRRRGISRLADRQKLTNTIAKAKLHELVPRTSATLSRSSDSHHAAISDEGLRECDQQHGSPQSVLAHSVLDPLLAFMNGADTDSWARFSRACHLLRNATRQHTSYSALVDGQPVELFRWGTVDGVQPRLYLTLPTPNVSRSCNWKGGSTGQTWWYKVRFDPETLMVHTGDYSFTRLETHRPRQANVEGRDQGRDNGYQVVVPNLGWAAPRQIVNVGEHTPYATCLDCSGANAHWAQSLVDLRGTPFAVASDFVHAGKKR